LQPASDRTLSNAFAKRWQHHFLRRIGGIATLSSCGLVASRLLAFIRRLLGCLCLRLLFLGLRGGGLRRSLVSGGLSCGSPAFAVARRPVTNTRQDSADLGGLIFLNQDFLKNSGDRRGYLSVYFVSRDL